MVSQPSPKFGGSRHCGNGDVMFWWLKGKLSHTLALIRHYFLFLNYMACQAHTHKIS